jgi:hypothetical protein
VRRNRRRSDHRLEKKRSREVSAYSTVFRGFGQKAGSGCNPRYRIRYRLESLVRMSRCFRKAYYLPLTPRLRAASISSQVSKFSLLLPDVVHVRQPAPPRSSVSPRQPVRWPRVPRRHSRWLVRLSLFRSAAKNERHAGEIQAQNNRPHIAMSCQPSSAWKASLTRTPPPICTSAPGSKTALVL